MISEKRLKEIEKLVNDADDFPMGGTLIALIETIRIQRRQIKALKLLIVMYKNRIKDYQETLKNHD